MKLCPVDLAGCDRPECRGGHCELADDAKPLTLCWECGFVEAHGIVAGICVACLETPVAHEHKET